MDKQKATTYLHTELSNGSNIYYTKVGKTQTTNGIKHKYLFLLIKQGCIAQNITTHIHSIFGYRLTKDNYLSLYSNDFTSIKYHFASTLNLPDDSYLCELL